MKLLVIGASRGIGRALTEQAIVARQDITLLVRDTSKVNAFGDRVRVVKGDVRNAEDVGRAMSGRNVVLTTIGIQPTREPVTTFSKGIQNVIAAMRENRVERLIAVTGIGAGDSRGHGGILYDWVVNPFFLRTIYEDKDLEEEIIRESGLDWTIVRPGFLHDGPLTKSYRTLTDLNGARARRVSRADVAHFLLREAEKGEYKRKAVLVDGGE